MKPVIIQLQQDPSGFFMMPYRGELLTKIKHTGWDNITDYCKSRNLNRSIMSEVINGKRWPDPPLQKELSFSLALSQSELLRLLGVKM